MATAVDRPLGSSSGNERFFLGAAAAMTLVIVAGFLTQLLMGRSTFYSLPLVHAHAIIFMGWVTIYLLQNIFIASDQMNLHPAPRLASRRMDYSDDCPRIFGDACHGSAGAGALFLSTTAVPDI